MNKDIQAHDNPGPEPTPPTSLFTELPQTLLAMVALILLASFGTVIESYALFAAKVLVILICLIGAYFIRTKECP